MMSAKSNPFELIPAEILQYIFNFCDRKTLLTLMQVNKCFFSTSDEVLTNNEFNFVKSDFEKYFVNTTIDAVNKLKYLNESIIKYSDNYFSDDESLVNKQKKISLLIILLMESMEHLSKKKIADFTLVRERKRIRVWEYRSYYKEWCNIRTPLNEIDIDKQANSMEQKYHQIDHLTNEDDANYTTAITENFDLLSNLLMELKDSILLDMKNFSATKFQKVLSYLWMRTPSENEILVNLLLNSLTTIEKKLAECRDMTSTVTYKNNN